VPFSWATPSAGMITLVGIETSLVPMRARHAVPVVPTVPIVQCLKKPGVQRFKRSTVE
jgi:hypothetical protein